MEGHILHLQHFVSYKTRTVLFRVIFLQTNIRKFLSVDLIFISIEKLRKQISKYAIISLFFCFNIMFTKLKGVPFISLVFLRYQLLLRKH